MRLFLAIVLSALTVSGMTQEPPRKPDMGKILPTTTKPIKLLPEVKGKPLLSVSEYYVEELKAKQRVFRYSWQEDYPKFLAKLRKRYVEKDGWTWEYSKESQSWDLTRMSKSGDVRMETYLIKGARLQKNPKSETGFEATYNKPGQPSWIWISYNERYAK